MPDSYFAEEASHSPHSPDELFARSLDLLCVAGFDGFFRRINPSWSRVLGWSERELLAQPSITFVHPDDVEATLAARARLEAGEPGIRLENRYRCKDGSYRWLAWQSVAVRANGTVFGVARDITAQRQQELLRQTTVRLESTAVFAGGIAHDFNNLLTTILLSLELAAQGGPLTPGQTANLAQARETALAARTLTQLLASLATGGNQVREWGNLPSLVTQAIADTRHPDVAVDWSAAPDLPPLRLDRRQILQALKQVLINAQEAAPAGSTVTVRADAVGVAADTPARLPAGHYVRIRVTDAGPGIPTEDLVRVFDPYYSTKPRGGQKGMGLGLAICHAVLRRHRGAISFASPPPTGTTVVLHLPVDDPAADDDREPLIDLHALRGASGG